MAYRTDSTLSIAGINNPVTIRLFTEDHRVGLFAGKATQVVQSGACYLQTYPDANECRAIARAYLAAACDLDTIAAMTDEPAQPLQSVEAA